MAGPANIPRREPSPQPGDISPERRAKVDAARQSWIRQLVDMSRRNNLIYFRDLKVGTLDFTSAPAEAMLDLLQSGKSDHRVALDDLVPAEKRTQATASLAEIAARARSNFEERGLETLFLALGLASWTAADGGRDSAAPILLMPLQVAQTSGRRGSWSLKRSGELKVNDVLVHALREEHGLAVDGDALVQAVLGDDEGEAFDLTPAFETLTAAATGVPGFAIARRWIVGNFAFQKMAIVKDLQQLGDALTRHDIVAGIAGDRSAADRACGDRGSVDPTQFDQTPPDQEFLILDTDSSQQQAIAATLRRQNGVISGPPGTGKSQTITNLIAETVARGETVLFVAEKRAALDVVLNRLKQAGLGHLCLDCHGAELTRRHVAEQLQESIERVREAPLPNADALHRTFTERRDRLNAHVRTLHTIRQPGGLSLYQLYGRILSQPSNVECTTRFPRQVLETLDENAVDDCAQKVRDLASLAPLMMRESTSPWNRARITSAEQLRTSLDTVRRLTRETWPAWQAAWTALLAECPATAPRCVEGVSALLPALSAIQETLRDNRESIFQADLPRLREELAPAGSLLRGLFALCFNGAYRQALRDVRAEHTGSALSPRQTRALVLQVSDQRATWDRIKADPAAVPKAWPRLAPAVAAWTAAREDLRTLAPTFPETPMESMAIAEIAGWVDTLVKDAITPAQLLRVHELETRLTECGLAPFFVDLRAHTPDPALWPSLLRDGWLRSCLEEAQVQDPSLPTFRGSLHDEIAAEFRELDKQRLAVARQRVGRAHAVAAVEARNTHRDQSTLVGREAAKRARHLPLRRLFADAPDVLLALRPCWMASPLSVSQLIPGERPLFDLVIFDEASQVLPEDAVTALLRGRQAVIAGDSRQLPPTTFFAAGVDDDDREDADEGTSGFQSILDVMSAFLEPAWSLDWHYRSRDEALIAYSNHAIYNDRLVTFPGPGLTKALTHVLVPHVTGQGGQEGSATREVQRVVELILEHASTRPDESLGVITMGIEHANRISMALARARDEHPDLEVFFDSQRAEPFFVKNLERVQGDERDAIILSIGYGKDETGDLVYRFGPLLQEGGERRLNVAITRARRRMTVVSSFSHEDMRPDYPKLGVRLLRGFLEYAAAEGRRLGAGRATDVALNEFEQSVFDELKRHGLNLVGQVGSSRYRIDMVAMHPVKPGRFVLAIECDGASYHSAPTARDRDRLRQQQLEALGWRFHRIWSTDWFLRREDEVRRTLKAFADAVDHADALDNHTVPIGTTTAPAPTPSLETPAGRPRDPKPHVLPGMDIDDYSPSQLQSLVRWVLSDGQLPTDDEIITELTHELGFHRKGPRIVAALSEAIRGAKQQA
jgi:very-short-patch-repair endonuclease